MNASSSSLPVPVENAGVVTVVLEADRSLEAVASMLIEAEAALAINTHRVVASNEWMRIMMQF
jgi:hypothetical protein